MIGLDRANILDRSAYRLEVNTFKIFHGGIKHASGWKEERRQVVREHMRRYRATKKVTRIVSVAYGGV